MSSQNAFTVMSFFFLSSHNYICRFPIAPRTFDLNSLALRGSEEMTTPLGSVEARRVYTLVAPNS